MMEPRETTSGVGGSSWIKRIVVAADGSPASTQGLKQVGDLAPRIGAKVIVVYVRHLPATAVVAPGTPDAGLIETLDDQEAEVRQEILRLFGGRDAEWEFVVRSGSPGEEIVQVADESGADLVVVGSNRHSSLHNLLLGSTAAYLATHSRTPVLVMRPRTPTSAVPATVGVIEGGLQQ
jgi:nucleotide-binding universal stress UspA family protein